MKNIFLITFSVLLIGTINAQDNVKRSYESVTYINDVSVSEIPTFVSLYEKFTNLSMGENRTMTGQWLFRHWYGSGHTFVIYTQYNSMEDYFDDTEAQTENIRSSIISLPEDERQAMWDDWATLRGFWDNHTDEIRGVYSDTGFLTVDNVDFDIPFVMSVGRYNSSGSWTEMGNAFFEWSIKPSIEDGSSIAGGLSYHYMGSGPEVEVWQCYKSLVDFANSVTSNSRAENKEARDTFWSLADGGHEDQIYLHIGHVNLETKRFDRPVESR